ncbi:MAG TPA: hypothetical protein PLV68_14090, partial [Ilumatobacteraceae bacterium]|nr:hypothetical protein [Ilumatobacteraceae bacterium]
HPPTKEQRQMLHLDHNPETFPAAAVAASAVDPVLTVDQAFRLQALLDQHQWDQVWHACLDANRGGATPKSVVAGAMARAREQLGLPPTTTESPDLSSLDGS